MTSRLRPTLALLVMATLLFAACTPAAPAPPTAAPVATTAPAPAAAAPTAAPAQPAAPAKVDKMTYAMASVSALYSPMFVGRKKGFYQKENLELDMLLVTGAPGQLQALVAKSAQISGVQMQATITAIEKGTISAHVLGSLVGQVPYTIVGQKDIKSIADLKGKRFGVSSVTGGEVALAKKVFAAGGIKPEDVEMIAAGVPTARVAALKGGTLAGTLVLPPDDAPLLAEGFTLLSRVADVVGEYPFLSYTVTDEYAKANSDVLVRFFKATSQANQWLFDPANKAEAVKIIAEETKMTNEAAQASYDFYIGRGILSKDMLIGEKATKAVLDLMVEIGDLKAPAPDWKKYLDLSYLEKATKQ